MGPKITLEKDIRNFIALNIAIEEILKDCFREP